MAGVACTAALIPAHAVTPPGWKDILYSNRADDQASLATVLKQFSAAMGVELRLADPKLGQQRMVVLPDKGSPPAVFMEQLAQSHALNWYVHRGVLYVSSQASAVSARVELQGQTPSAARQALVGLGLFESRFGWGELDSDPPVVLIEGPATYVKAVRDAIETPKTTAEPERPRLMVFRLKHAVAQDREVMVRGMLTRLPGLASTLKELVAPRGNAGAGLDLNGPGSGGRAGSVFGAEMGAGIGAGGTTPAPVLPPALGGLTSGTGLGALNLLGGREFLGAALPDKLLPGRRKSGDSEDDNKRREEQNLPTIGAYAPLNAVVVWDLPSRRAEYAEVIQELDVAPRQVEINVTILDVNVNALREWAAEFSLAGRTAGVQVNAAGTLGDNTSALAGGGSMVLWATDRLTLRLRNLESHGQAQVLSRPSILTQDNHAAVLDMSQSVYVKLVGERATDLRTVSAGTTLRVTPSILGEGADAHIRVSLDIDDGALGDNASQATSPSSGNSSVSTQAVVRPGESLVVGGYRRQNTETSHNRVPGLDRVPLLGWLFRGESVISNERERLFIVTARVLP